jgi:SAM-dependent methyltransferase
MSQKTNQYYDEEFLRRANDGVSHRRAIGGLWDPMGNLQQEFLIANGLGPSDRLLDVGCGSLRLGSKLVDYLAPGGYFGCDLAESLIDAGYQHELTDDQRARLPRTNLWTTDCFDFSPLPAPANFAMAQSLFSHLPPAFLRLCLWNLTRHMAPNGKFFATFFLVDDSHPINEPGTHAIPEGGQAVPTSALRDPYHYWIADLHHSARDLAWEVRVIGDWKHPRGQQMVEFRKKP